MKILVVGSGTREHALVKKLSREPSVDGVVCAPGNAGVEREHSTGAVSLDISDPEAILSIAESEAVDLTVVGPELPLANGVADLFENHSVARKTAFSPTALTDRPLQICLHRSRCLIYIVTIEAETRFKA